jgi:hypothetical protein
MPSPKKIKVVIDRSKWRTGDESRHRTGSGYTKLLNTEGYMCCLGFCCKASRVGVKRIQGRTAPNSIISSHKKGNCLPQRVLKLRGLRALVELTERNDRITANCNPLARSAIIINDDADTTPKEKEQQLLELFKDSVFELEFTGEYEKR